MIYTKLFKKSDGTNNSCAQIHSNHYGNSFEHISEMVKQLKEDFNHKQGCFITDSDIKVGKFGGNRIKGISFVEIFLPKEVKMPDDYEEIKELEYTL